MFLKLAWLLVVLTPHEELAAFTCCATVPQDQNEYADYDALLAGIDSLQPGGASVYPQ